MKRYDSEVMDFCRRRIGTRGGFPTTGEQQTMAKPTTGGPAFPNRDLMDPARNGMTLRDWFAGQALAGMAGSYENGVSAARDAFAFADAMLAERQKGHGR